MKIIIFISLSFFLTCSFLEALHKENKNIMTKHLAISFTFKKVTPDDLPLLFKWFQEPHIQKWWPVPEKDEFFEKFLARIRSKETVPYLAFLDNQPIGYIQYYHIDRTLEKAGAWLPADLPETTVGIDQFIGNPEYIGKGYGTEFIKEFIKYLANVLEPNVTTIITDPEPENFAAIRCYEKVGFKHIGTYITPHGSTAYLMKYELDKLHKSAV